MYGNNYLNPYQVAVPMAAKRSIDWGNLLNNTQKTLGIINQAIPLVYQLKPIVSNAKTMLRIFDALKSESRDKERVRSTPSSHITNESSNDNFYSTSNNNPQFFI